MADEETQGQQDTLWWAPEAPSEASLQTTGFDEPLVWPETAWDMPGDGEAAAAVAGGPGDLDAEFVFPPAEDLPPSPPDWDPAAVEPLDDAAGGTDDDAAATIHRDPLGGLGGNSDWWAPETPAADGSPIGAVTDAALPTSMWAADTADGPGDAVLVTTTLASAGPALYAEAERGGGPRRHRFDVRSGNVAVIALISLVSLVLLGMFLSVRGRDDLGTDVSQQRPPGDQVLVTSPLNTIPFSPTTVSTPGSINIAELVPATDATDATTAPATTVAPTRSTTPTTAATQPTTATTAAPATTSTAVTTTVTTTPVEDTSTTIRRTTTSFTLPTFPSSTIPNTSITFPFPGR